MLGIKEYPTPTVVGMFDTLLSAPFPFVLSQSFSFLSKATAQALLQRQHARMGNAGDFAVTQARYDALTGQVQTFAATFTQHCEGGTTALTGSINYRSS